MSAIILAVDSSTVDVSVALLDGDRVIAASRRPATKGETGSLLDDIRHILADGSLTLADISLYAVGIGPGNFTGLRISAAAIQALALPSGAPVIGICSADAIADAVLRQYGDNPVAIVGDARRERLWMLDYPRTGPDGNRPEPRVTAIAEAASLLDKRGLVIATPDWSRIGPVLEQIVPPSAMLISENRLPDAATIGSLALERYRQGVDTGPIDPIYVHPPVFIDPVFTGSARRHPAPTP